jgi:mevalonate kinase
MPAISESAPGKIILFGEHAVVYNRPAIAVPVLQVRAKAVITPDLRRPRGDILIDAPDIGLHASYLDLPDQDPFRILILTIQEYLGINQLPAMQVRITSTIPVAAGLGSGSAVSVAVARAISSFVGRPFTVSEISEVAYSVEKAHHGSPSGIDNTVIAYAQPIYFQRGQPIQHLFPIQPFMLIIADSGVQSSTASVVGDVRQSWQAHSDRYEALFDAVGDIVVQARQAVEHGPIEPLGDLMNDNHQQLQLIGVSSPELDRLVEAALTAGASGAKLSGGGRGGNMIAMVTSASIDAVEAALRAAGAVRIIATTVQPVKVRED